MMYMTSYKLHHACNISFLEISLNSQDPIINYLGFGYTNIVLNLRKSMAEFLVMYVIKCMMM